MRAAFLRVGPPFAANGASIPRQKELHSSPEGASFLAKRRLLPRQKTVRETGGRLSSTFFTCPARQGRTLVSIVVGRVTRGHHAVTLLFRSRESGRAVVRRVADGVGAPGRPAVRGATPALQRTAADIFLPRFVCVLSV